MRFLIRRSCLLSWGLSVAGVACGIEHLPAEYQSFSAEEKLSQVWERIDTPYETLPPIGSAQLGWFGSNLCPAHLLPAFDLRSDEMPPGRQKMIHRSGVAAKVEYVPNTQDHELSGVLESGSLAILRLSLATDPSKSFIPGAAFKFLIDGKPSVNIQVMHSLDGQGQDHNFFQHPFSNDIKEPTSPILKILSWFFSQIKTPPTHLSVLPLVQVTRQGNLVEEASAPPGDILIFRPTPEARQLIPSDSTEDFRLDLMQQVKEGVQLYEVCVRRNAEDPDTLVVIGGIHMRSPFVASAYEDDVLLFQHPR